MDDELGQLMQEQQQEINQMGEENGTMSVVPATSGTSSKTLWIIGGVGVVLVGALVYFLVIRKKTASTTSNIPIQNQYETFNNQKTYNTKNNTTNLKQAITKNYNQKTYNTTNDTTNNSTTNNTTETTVEKSVPQTVTTPITKPMVSAHIPVTHHISSDVVHTSTGDTAHTVKSTGVTQIDLHTMAKTPKTPKSQTSSDQSLIQSGQRSLIHTSSGVTAHTINNTGTSQIDLGTLHEPTIPRVDSAHRSSSVVTPRTSYGKVRISPVSQDTTPHVVYSFNHYVSNNGRDDRFQVYNHMSDGANVPTGQYVTKPMAAKTSYGRLRIV
jgi:cytoskeletal protein RodZ